ncbi:hypothetical protein PoB_004206400 [Plakobranchus ocellatus]|uniref:Uncharacterized protein n=1 Tax=Plakobranchus ocellatus TaxID=259542 RepID=A0AAV4B636_9GAST|nr:hypothetical protein PoB_004206400 [Plakobranchus ocellatus]
MQREKLTSYGLFVSNTQSTLRRSQTLWHPYSRTPMTGFCKSQGESDSPSTTGIAMSSPHHTGSSSVESIENSKRGWLGKAERKNIIGFGTGKFFFRLIETKYITASCKTFRGEDQQKI